MNQAKIKLDERGSIMEFFGFGIFVLMALGLFRCTTEYSLANNVKSASSFYLEGSEYSCSKTQRQLKIDELKKQIDSMKSDHHSR